MYVKHAFLIYHLCIQEAPVLLPCNSYVFWEINLLDKLQQKKKLLKTFSYFSLYSAIKEQRCYPVLFNKINFSSIYKIFGIGFWLHLVTIQLKLKFEADQRVRLASINTLFTLKIATKNVPAETPNVLLGKFENFKLLNNK